MSEKNTPTISSTSSKNITRSPPTGLATDTSAFTCTGITTTIRFTYLCLVMSRKHSLFFNKKLRRYKTNRSHTHQSSMEPRNNTPKQHRQHPLSIPKERSSSNKSVENSYFTGALSTAHYSCPSAPSHRSPPNRQRTHSHTRASYSITSPLKKKLSSPTNAAT